jgi:hypothetical protein
MKNNKEDRFEYRKAYKERVVKSGKDYDKKKQKKRSKFYEDFQDEDE